MKLFISLLIFLLIFSCGSESKSSKSDSKSRSSNTLSNIYSKKKAKTNNGTYLKETRDGKMTVIISGNSWRVKKVIKTGFGDTYDNQNAQNDRGLAKGNDLYDESGYVKIGSVSGNSVRIAGYTLYK